MSYLRIHCHDMTHITHHSISSAIGMLLTSVCDAVHCGKRCILQQKYLNTEQLNRNLESVT